LEKKPLTPLYVAVIACTATASEEAVSVADPEELSGAVPSGVVPSWKVTVPIGVPDLEAGLTVAVNAIACPNTEGFVDEVTATEVACFPWTVVVAVADLVSSATEVAVTVTVSGLPMAAGAL
jgi:hypothetical protein